MAPSNSAAEPVTAGVWGAVMVWYSFWFASGERMFLCMPVEMCAQALRGA